MNFKSIVVNYWKSIAIVAVICYLSFASPSAFKTIPTFENEDKIVHILMYVGLAAVLIYDFRRAKTTNVKTLGFVLICIIFPSLLGGVIEIMQEKFFAPRTANWFDWLSDVAGVVIGWLSMTFLFPKLGKSK